MENLTTTMSEALADLEKALDPETIDADEVEQEPEDDVEKGLEFDLVKSEELADYEEVKSNFVDVDPFFAHITELVSLNNGRIAKGIEGLLNFAKSQSAVIDGLLEKVSSLSETVDAIASAPGERKGALSGREAEEMQKSLFGREFVDAEVPEASITPESVVAGANVRQRAMDALTKSWQAAPLETRERNVLGNAVIRLNSIPGIYSVEDAVAQLPPEAQKVIMEALAE